MSPILPSTPPPKRSVIANRNSTPSPTKKRSSNPVSSGAPMPPKKRSSISSTIGDRAGPTIKSASPDDIERYNLHRDGRHTSSITENLKNNLKRAHTESDVQYTKYVPLCEQKKILSSEKVFEYLVCACPQLSVEKAVDYRDRICFKARKLFATLVYIERGSCICALLDENLSDADLPLERQVWEAAARNEEHPDTEDDISDQDDYEIDNGNKAVEKAEQKIHQNDVNTHRGLVLLRRNGKPISSLDGWSREDLNKLGKKQFLMLAPKFKTGPLQHDLDKRFVLPYVSFLDLGTIKEGSQGGYSEVFKRKIHSAHNNFWKDGSRPEKKQCVAIKRLNSTDEEEFTKETSILEKLGKKPHPHLVKLFTTFKYDRHPHLVFPWADSNLRQYWERRSKPMFEYRKVFWMLQQMRGICSALSSIHHFRTTLPLDVSGQVPKQKDSGLLKVNASEKMYGRHGDIKPENFLWFRDCLHTKDSQGVIQIADFGLGRFHGRDSRSNIHPTDAHGTMSYEPPECQLRLQVSRKYDIWSLGCVYLEFVTWVLKGNKSLHDFADQRGGTEDTRGIDADRFYQVITQPNGNRSAVVGPNVMKWAEELHAHSNCTLMIHTLLDIIMDHMLVVDQENRIHAAGLVDKLTKLEENALRDKDFAIKASLRPTRAHHRRASVSPNRAMTWPNQGPKVNITQAE